VKPPEPEIDPFKMTSLQAAFAIQAISLEILQEVFNIFKEVTGIQEVIDLISIGVLSRHLFQMLTVEAEMRSMRVSTLVILIVKGFKLVFENQEE